MAEGGTITIARGQEVAAADVHWLPVKTAHNGPCRAREFFHPQPSSDETASGLPVLQASLRGRHLKGCTRALPAGVGGVIVAPAAAAASAAADGERAWASAATFRGLTCWNHDAAPAASDWQARALDWLVLAVRVHAPVALKDVEEEAARLAGANGEACTAAAASAVALGG